MDNKPSGKVKSAKISNPTSYSPDPVCKRIVDKCCPQNEEDKVGLEFKSFGKCAGNQSGCNHSKHHLEDHKCLVRNCGCVVRVGIKSHTSEPNPFKTSDNVANIRAKCETVSV